MNELPPTQFYFNSRYKDDRQSRDRVAQLYNGAVGGVEADEARAWVIEVEHRVNSNGDEARVEQTMNPAPVAALCHGVAREQAAHEREGDQQREDECRQVRAQRDGARGGDVDHVVQCREEQLRNI